MPPLIDSIKEQLGENKELLVIVATAIISALGGLWATGSVTGMLEGVSIAIVAILILTFQIFADWNKDKRFV